PSATAAVTVGNLTTKSAGEAGAGGPMPNRMRGTKMKTIPPSMPASPPHRRTLLSSIDFPIPGIVSADINWRFLKDPPRNEAAEIFAWLSRESRDAGESFFYCSNPFVRWKNLAHRQDDHTKEL